MLQTGTQAPNFTLPAASDVDDSLKEVSLTDALADGPVLLNFYVFDFHPACTDNVCELHDLAWFDLDTSLTVVGISTDSVYSHRAFAAAEGLDFTLLSDSDGSTAESYGVLYDEFNGHRRIAKRSVFLVDTDGTVVYAWATDDPGTQPDFDAVKAAVESVRDGERT